MRKKMMGGGMSNRMMYKNGTTKSGKKKINPKEQPGLAKLKKKAPQVVAKMGYFKKGGKVFCALVRPLPPLPNFFLIIFFLL